MTCVDKRFPSGHFSAPRIQDGHRDVASNQTPIGIDEAAQANITMIAGTSHHMLSEAYGTWHRIRPNFGLESLTPVVDPSSSAFWCVLARLGAPISYSKRGFEWSGRRASNPLPRPWQGRALPSELLPLEQRCMIPRLPRPTHAGAASPQWAKGRPHLSRIAFTRIADSCSFPRSSRPERTAARTAAIAVRS